MHDEATKQLRGNAVDLTGSRKRTWTISGLAPKRHKGKNLAWYARCDCGREKVVTSNHWSRGGGACCPVCEPLPPQAHDLMGQRKETWTIVSFHSVKPVRWVARCECGRERVVSAGNWRNRGYTTCECQPRLNYNQLPDGESSFNTLYAGYVRRAEKRGFRWKLTREQFRALTIRPCTYCGVPPSQIRNTTRSTPGYRYTGVDRIDPAGDYTTGNVTPCCGACNRAKSDLTQKEWREQIQRLWEHLLTW